MTKSLQLFFLLTVFFLGSCKKEISDLEFEKNVMTEIFPDLMDSICFDNRSIPVPPPIFGEFIYDKEGNCIGVDSTKGTEKQKQEILQWKLNQIAIDEAIEKDTSKLIIAFNPEIKRGSKDLKEYLEEHFKVTEVFYPKIERDSTYTIDFKNIPIKGKFELRNISEFPADRYEFWKKNIISFLGVLFIFRESNLTRRKNLVS